MGCLFKRSLILFAGLLACMQAHALETDQFFAWGKPIEDSTDYLDAWVRVQVEQALDPALGDQPADCEAAVNAIQKRLQRSIYQPIEIWITSTSLVDRVPKDLQENRDYRANYLLSDTVPFDFARWLHPSPTLQVNGIRIGADKLAHFFSEGWWYYRKWRKNGRTDINQADEQQLVDYGVVLEKWVQGHLLTGIISPADMEANLQGFFFYHRLCHGEEPLLYRQQGRWLFSDRYTIADYVYPRWDESWNPNIYSKRRWPGIRRTMSRYCEQLEGDWVRQQREEYRALDSMTPVAGAIEEQVQAGLLPDPMQFDITTVCAR